MMMNIMNIKDNNSCVEDNFFSPEECKEHFMQVSATRYDRPEGEIKSLIDSLEQRRDTVAREAARKIEMEFTVQEVEREVALMKDGASGIDGVRLIWINAADNTTKEKFSRASYNCLKQIQTPGPRKPKKDGWYPFTRRVQRTIYKTTEAFASFL